MKSDWEFDHVGLVVRDLDEILTYYPQIGIGVNIGPLGNGAVWPVPGSPEEEPVPWTMTVYGKPHTNPPRNPPSEAVPVNRVIANLQVGSLVVECIHGRPDGNGFNDDFFRDYGDGISHICFNVPDPEKETAALLKKGCADIMSLVRSGKIVENYLGTAQYGNIWLSFRPMPDKTHRAWQTHNRAHPLVSDWEFRGMGVATRDLDNATEYYRSLKVATVQPEVMLDSSSSPDFKVHGLTGCQAKARTRKAMIGSVAYEFAQTLEQETTLGEFLSRRGEGAFSLDFAVKDLRRETARLTYRGIRVVLSGKPKRGGAFAFFDTRKVGNMMVKLVQAEDK
jgi:hypothetical protein